MRIRYIYKVTYLPTGQFYIGKRKGKEDCKPEEDFGTYYFTSAVADKNRWIRKSLKENPELWKIEFLHVNVESSEKLAELEIKELKPYFNKSKCINDLCLNKCNPEFSNNIDVSGYRHTDEYKEYMRKINFSENNPFYGKTHSEKSRKLIGKKSKGRRKSEEEKKNQSEFMKKNNPMFNPEHRKKFYESIHSPEYIEKKRQMALGEKNGNYGHHWDNDMKESLSKKKKGLKAYNNGKICVMRKECPEGFVLGTLKRKHKSYNNTEDKND